MRIIKLILHRGAEIRQCSWRIQIMMSVTQIPRRGLITMFCARFEKCALNGSWSHTLSYEREKEILTGYLPFAHYPPREWASPGQYRIMYWSPYDMRIQREPHCTGNLNSVTSSVLTVSRSVFLHQFYCRHLLNEEITSVLVHDPLLRPANENCKGLAFCESLPQ